MRPRLPSGPGDAGGLGWRRRREREADGLKMWGRVRADGTRHGAGRGDEGGRGWFSLRGVWGGAPGSQRPARPAPVGSGLGRASPAHPQWHAGGPVALGPRGNGSRRCRFPLFPSPGETGFLLEIELGWPVLSGPRVAHFPGFQT